MLHTKHWLVIDLAQDRPPPSNTLPCDITYPGPRSAQDPASISEPSPGAAVSFVRALGGGTPLARGHMLFLCLNIPVGGFSNEDS